MELFADENSRNEILKLHNISKEGLRKKISKLKEWVKKHPEFPTSSQDDNFLDMMLMRNKYDVEKAKHRIKLYFDAILEYSEIFCDSRALKPSEEVILLIPLPKLTQKLERGLIVTFKDSASEDFNVERFVVAAGKIGLIMHILDYVPCLRVIMDFNGVTLSHMLKVTPSTWLKLIGLHEKMLKARIAGIEFLNAPQILSKLLFLGKALLKPKLFSRITVHENLESLHKNVPKECLPSDYGGDLKSSEYWLKMLDKTMVDHPEILKQIVKYVENQEVKINNPYGIQGSFKSLEVD